MLAVIGAIALGLVVLAFFGPIGLFVLVALVGLVKLLKK